MDCIKKLLFVLLLLTNFSYAKNVVGIDIPESSAELELNGVGVRNKFFFDLYIGALYLQSKNNNAQNIMGKDEKMGIKLHIISSMITSEKMEKATRDGFENALGNKVGAMQAKIDDFISVFKEEIKLNDVYDLVYTPNVGVDIYKNNKYKKTIKGLDFKKALFGIWLGSEPAQKSLKEAMLGLE